MQKSKNSANSAQAVVTPQTVKTATAPAPTAWQLKMQAITAQQEAEQAKKAEAKKLAEASAKGKGVIKTIFNTIAEAKQPVNQAQILEVLKTEFPNREVSSMQNTIKAQIGSAKRPLRMETEQQCIFNIAVNQAGVKTYSLMFKAE